MLTLITGQPGNGKTLHALGVVEEMRLAPMKDVPPLPSRQTYYSGISELTLPWVELDAPEKWHEMPSGSLVVIDECQRVFPPRKQGAQVPEHVKQFETHRHKGFDVVLITQHPQLLDIAVRKLVGRHVHVVRKFGRDQTTLQQWERCVDPHDRSIQAQALVTKVPLAKERFGWYKSAEIHTVKKDFPKRKLALLAACALGIPALIWFAVDRVRSKGDAQAAIAAEGNAWENMPGRGPGPGGRGVSGAWSVDTFEERVAGIAYTAPLYDGGFKVSDIPMVSGCMVMQVGHRKTCKCTTAQGTVLNIDTRQCLAHYDRGTFDPRGKARYPTIQPYVPPLAGSADDSGGRPEGGVAAPAAPEGHSLGSG